MAKNIFIPIKVKGAKKAGKDLGGVDSKLKGLAKSAGLAAAGFFGGRALLAGMNKSIDLAAKFQGVETAFKNLAKSTGFSSQAFEKFQDATDGTIDSIELMTQANNAMLLGITDSEDEMAELFDIAQRLAQGLGQDTRFGIESLVTGLGRQSKLMLDNLGIMIDVEKANEDYAESLNKSASSLTDQERKQAFLNAAMDSGRRLVEQMGDEQLTLASAMDQARSASSDVSIEIGETLSPVIVSIASKFAGAASAVANYMKELRMTTADITEMTSAEEKEEILLAKIADKRNQILNIGLQLDEMITGDKGVHRKKLENELLQLQVQLVESVNERKQNELDISLQKIEADSTSLGLINEIATSEATALDIRREDVAVGDEKIEQVTTLLEMEKLTAEERAAIQTEFNSRYLQSVKGTYALEMKEITEAMKRYAKVEKDKTKLADMENSLRRKLNLDTAQAAVAGFASSMQKMADIGMVSQKDAKRLAAVQATIDALAAANAAYKAMAGIPVIGPALGAIAAAAALGAGYANVKAIESAETGFDGVVNQPTLFMTGEGNKREHVAVRPLEGPNINGPQGGITINVSAPLVDETVIDSIIPAIQKAQRLDLA